MMRLSERMGVSLHKLLSDYSRQELNLWLAWISKEPSEGERIELAVAQLSTLTYNINSNKKDHKNPSDFMFKPNWKPKPTEKQVKRDIYKIDRAFGI